MTNKPDVNILMCSSQPAARDPHPNEVVLDQADGLSGPTLSKCDLIHMVVKTELKQRRGLVSAERRRAIVTTINRSNEWI